MKPFNEFDLQQLFNDILSDVNSQIERMTNEEIMANDIAILANNIYQTSFLIPLTIMDEDFSKRSIIQKKVTRYVNELFRTPYAPDYLEVDGINASFFFPFSGNKKLLSCRASTYSFGYYPDISISDNCVVISIEKTLNEMQKENAIEKLLAQVNDEIDQIKKGVELANSDVTAFNKRLEKTIEEKLLKRKNNIQSYYDIAQMLEVPIEKKEYVINRVEIERRIVPISHKYDSEDYYCISDKNYIDILEAIKHTCTTYERTPESYKGMHEEDLRNTLLGTLNAIYKGSATGETFRRTGKTDICIEFKNRSAFVAECKMWKGQSRIKDAINQLDSYLTWRDCKTALLFFVRNKDFYEILGKTSQELKKIEGMKNVKSIDKNEFECGYFSNSNPGQLIKIHIMLFNLYSE